MTQSENQAMLERLKAAAEGNHCEWYASPHIRADLSAAIGLIEKQAALNSHAEMLAALKEILGWRELRSGANEIPIERIEEIARTAIANAERAETFCIECGNLVDTREVEEGGGPDGAQLSSGVWVCSCKCWDARAERKEK